ncbi:hypothetical protein EXIGLDRAFT_719760 [Exidia glandulosa HHB12029]|uniref:Uncharacterized protein n=1 Tax=Exidia glandulosa HHB12029 TaxID=1314781 RepID=A0A165GUQ0_EXIGL|nr:hypothetical protein EXIGLDRAFT_719760 [Exidia glandulosa HHB12029]
MHQTSLVILSVLIDVYILYLLNVPNSAYILYPIVLFNVWHVLMIFIRVVLLAPVRRPEGP